MEIPRGGGSNVKPSEMENPGGWGVKLEKTLHGGVWVFSGTTHCCAVTEPGQQKHQSYRDEEIIRSKVPAVMMMMMTMMINRIRLRLHILYAQLKSTFWKSHWGRIYFIQILGKNCGLSLLLKLEVIQH